jgi:alpha-D-xyloside xylohydrolase
MFLSVVAWGILAIAGTAGAQWNPLNPVTGVKEQADGVVLTMQRGTLRLLVCSDSIVRVTYAPGAAFPDTPQYVVTKSTWPVVPFTFDATDAAVTISTAKFEVKVTKKDGYILFSNGAGKKLFMDSDRTLKPVEVNGEKTYHAEVFSNLWDSTEAFYGLGQHQAGVINYHGEDVELSQDNTNISVPMVLSSKGYGIFWNNPSRSRFNNRFPHALFLSSEVADTVEYYFI